MRTLLVFAVLAVLLAGCTSNNSGTPATPTPGGNSTGTGTGGATMAKVLKSGTVTWPTDCSTPGSAAGQGACTPVAVTVDSGYSTLNFTVTWSCNTTPACTSNGASIAVGSLTCAAPQSIDPVQNPSPAPCVKTGPATAGSVKITPSGDANMVASYKLTEQ